MGVDEVARREAGHDDPMHEVITAAQAKAAAQAAPAESATS